MGKKKKQSKELSILSTPIVKAKQDFIKKLGLLAEQKSLTIGFNAVLRLLKKAALGLVITSKKMCSPLFHEMNLMCESKNIPLLSLEEEFIKELKVKATRISAMGLKKEVFDQNEELKQYVDKLLNKRKTKEIDQLQLQVKTELEKLSNPTVSLINETQKIVPDSPVTIQHNWKSSISNQRTHKAIKAKPFISLNESSVIEFPEYKPFCNVEKLIINIRDNETLSYILNS